MLNLALDTSTRWGRFALAEGDRLLGYLPVNVSGNYADQVLPVIARLLGEAGRRLQQVEAIGVTRGPGSFTGVRIGVATAAGLAYALGIRLVAVTTLEAMAAAMLAEFTECQLAVPVLDARRNEVFAAVYRRQTPWVVPLAAPAALAPAGWWERLGPLLADQDEPVWGGSGLSLLVGQGTRLRAELQTRGKPVRRRWTAAHPATARALALVMGAAAVRLPSCHPFQLSPLYLRASDAEVKRGLDLTPRQPEAQLPWPPERKSGGRPQAGPDLRLRPATPADLSQVLVVEKQSFGDPWPRAALLSELQPDRMRVPLVAERGGRLVAYLMAWRIVDQLHVLNLAVAPEERRSGIGTRLLEASLNAAAASGLRIATLEVRPSNAAAQAFYAHRGFVVAGRRRHYYADTGEDAIIMNRVLLPVAG